MLGFSCNFLPNYNGKITCLWHWSHQTMSNDSNPNIRAIVTQYIIWPKFIWKESSRRMDIGSRLFYLGHLHMCIYIYPLPPLITFLISSPKVQLSFIQCQTCSKAIECTNLDVDDIFVLLLGQTVLLQNCMKNDP